MSNEKNQEFDEPQKESLDTAKLVDIEDLSKRFYTFGLGSLIGVLGACTAPQNPAATRKPPESPIDDGHGKAQGNDTGNQVNNPNNPNNSINDINAENCIMCQPGVTPPVGIPTPPGGVPVPGAGTGTPIGGAVPNPPGSGVTTPVPNPPATGTPPTTGTPPPATTPTPPTGEPPVTAPPPTTGSGLTTQTFSSLGPGLINIKSSDMFGQTDQVMSDGTLIKVWGFTSTAGGAFNDDLDRLCPGPVIELIEGEAGVIALSSQHPHTIHLHGLDVAQAFDGVPSTSGYVSQMNNASPFFNPIFPSRGVRLGNPYEYKFIAPHAGTYLYHCHVDTALHMEMGMSGTIIVRPPDSSKNVLWTGGPVFDREYIWQLHTFDSSWHNVGNVSSSATVRYSPDYFLLNGRDGVDLLTDSSSAIQGLPGEQIVIRLVNIGYPPAVVNLGGIPFVVAASDGRPLKKSLNLLTELLVAPGERYDIMFTMPNAGISNASINYLDIRGKSVLGSVSTTITTIA